MYHADINIIAIEGKTVTEIQNTPADEVVFSCSDGSEYKMYHAQDCCESVGIESGAEDLPKLVGKTITKVVEIIEQIPGGESATRTTFEFLLLNAMPVKLVWVGCSNGYYSESVNFGQVK